MVLAAGLGTRLRPLTGSISKPMAPIVNRPVMYHILRLLKKHGFNEAVANLHYHPHAITNYFGRGQRIGIELRYSLEPELMGTAGGVKAMQRFLADGTFLVISGDALTDIDLTKLLAQHRQSGGIATLALKRVEDPSKFGVVIRDKGGRILGFQEKPAPGEELSNLCNCGIYIFEPAIFRLHPQGLFLRFRLAALPRFRHQGHPLLRIRDRWLLERRRQPRAIPHRQLRRADRQGQGGDPRQGALSRDLCGQGHADSEDRPN